MALYGCAWGGEAALYTGTLQATGGTCDPPAQASLQVRNNAVMFTPNLGTLTLHGTNAPGGAFHAELTVLGADKKAYRLTFDGAAVPGSKSGTIEGRYVTPRCAYRITLHKL